MLHQLAQLLAPVCSPHYLSAIVPHVGHWVQPPRRLPTGPVPTPRWMPRAELLYAQVVKTVRRRRIVEVKHRVVVYLSPADKSHRLTR